MSKRPPYCRICHRQHYKADNCKPEDKAHAVDCLVELLTRDIAEMLELLVRKRLQLWADEIRPYVDAERDELLKENDDQ